MKIIRFAAAAMIMAIAATAPVLAQGRVNNLSVSVNIIGKGITGIGPTDTEYVNAADDPTRRASTHP